MRKIIFTLFLLTLFTQSKAQKIRVAVAANAYSVVRLIQKEFTKSTGIEVEVISGSSGKLAAQIKNGAPYHLFLSADMDFPGTLHKKGHTTGAPQVYALGSLVVCSTTGMDVKAWRSLITTGKLGKVAIANPSLAPYGKAAQQALTKYGLWDKMKSKIVYGESIAQVNTYITTGTVDLGLTTESLIHERADPKLKWLRVDENFYDEIKQGMVVLNYAKKNNYEAALRFYSYLLTAPARALFRKYGYLLPKFK